MQTGWNDHLDFWHSHKPFHPEPELHARRVLADLDKKERKNFAPLDNNCFRDTKQTNPSVVSSVPLLCSHQNRWNLYFSLKQNGACRAWSNEACKHHRAIFIVTSVHNDRPQRHQNPRNHGPTKLDNLLLIDKHRVTTIAGAASSQKLFAKLFSTTICLANHAIWLGADDLILFQNKSADLIWSPTECPDCPHWRRFKVWEVKWIFSRHCVVWGNLADRRGMVLTQMLELVRRCGSDATKCCKLQPVHGGSGVEIGAARVSAVAFFFLHARIVSHCWRLFTVWDVKRMFFVPLRFCEPGLQIASGPWKSS